MVVRYVSRWAIAPVIDSLVVLETGAIALRLRFLNHECIAESLDNFRYAFYDSDKNRQPI